MDGEVVVTLCLLLCLFPVAALTNDCKLTAQSNGNSFSYALAGLSWEQTYVLQDTQGEAVSSFPSFLEFLVFLGLWLHCNLYFHFLRIFSCISPTSLCYGQLLLAFTVFPILCKGPFPQIRSHTQVLGIRTQSYLFEASILPLLLLSYNILCRLLLEIHTVWSEPCISPGSSHGGYWWPHLAMTEIEVKLTVGKSLNMKWV